MVSLFVDEMHAMAAVKDGSLNAESRRYLATMSDDPGIEQVWAGIEKNCGTQPPIVVRYFIRDVLLARSAPITDDDHFERAITTEAGGNDELIQFTRRLSFCMQQYFGRWLDEEVASLTNIFFPQAHVTTDFVQTTRKPAPPKLSSDIRQRL